MDDMKGNIDFIKTVLSLHDEMVTNGFSLVYEGVFSHDIMKMFTSMTENNMDKQNEDKTVKRKVFHVMVECLQNMTKHSDDYDYKERVGTGLFIVGKKGGYWNIITANKIHVSKIDDLSSSIDKINSMSPEELKMYYKKQIREGQISEKGGAGLGFIDIARKTGSKLNYQFLPLSDNQNYFFMLKVKISAVADSSETE